MRERATWHIPDQESVLNEDKSDKDPPHKPMTLRQKKLQRKVDRILKHIDFLEKSKIVTQETMNLEFTI